MEIYKIKLTKEQYLTFTDLFDDNGYINLNSGKYYETKKDLENDGINEDDNKLYDKYKIVSADILYNKDFLYETDYYELDDEHVLLILLIGNSEDENWY